jgi:hypothetical protein
MKAIVVMTVPGEDAPGLARIDRVRELYFGFRRAGKPAAEALLKAKRRYLMEVEYETKNVTPETYRRKCEHCGRAGQVHIFDDTCPRFQ